MKVPPYVRIQWFHEELSRKTYPNAARLSEQFHISTRQAQRDITYLRDALKAPLRFDPTRQGYAYTTPYSLPVAMVSENDESRTHVLETGFSAASDDTEFPEADSVIIQSQIPYTAVLKIEDRLTVLEMRSYILSRESAGVYLCEFHNIDRFLCAVLTARSGIRIMEPEWLRKRLLRMAEQALKSNGDSDSGGTDG